MFIWFKRGNLCKKIQLVKDERIDLQEQKEDSYFFLPKAVKTVTHTTEQAYFF